MNKIQKQPTESHNPTRLQDRTLHILFETMTECWGDEPAQQDDDAGDEEIAASDVYGVLEDEPREEVDGEPPHEEVDGSGEVDALEQQLQILRPLG